MKYMFASDIHGSAYFCRKTLEAYKKSGAARLILLGDILYHGPRNEFPKEYEPKQVLSMLNEYRNEIYAVRGNCDSEVDQMVLEFPILAEYALISLGGHTFYATHGHVYHQDHLPPLQAGDILLHGHTHLYKAEWVEIEEKGRIGIANPGSVSIPKGGNPPTYGLLTEEKFMVLTFGQDVVKEMDLRENNKK